MRRRFFFFAGSAVCLILALGSLWLACEVARAQDPVSDLLVLINNARLTRGLYPYVISDELTVAAQRHSDDMAATGQINHTGSDGSSSTQRILQAGYGVYEFGLLASENIYGGMGGAEVPLNAWMEMSGARANLLHEKYREVGIGAARDVQGRMFWTLDVGAQPNVLPVLINDGAATVDAVTVTLRLVPENAVPGGLGTAIGQPVEYRASTSSQFVNAEWASWAEQVIFVLDEQPSEQTVYVQLRDTAGRTTISQASVILAGLEGTVTPSETVAAEASGTPTPTLTITATVVPSPSPTPQASLTPTEMATATPTEMPTRTPTASSTPQPTATLMPSASATNTPPPTELPTAVPPPTAVATSPPPTRPPLEVAAAIPTPSRSMASHIVVTGEPESQSLASRLAPWALGLQFVALMLGVYVVLRRPGDNVGDED